MALVKKKSKKLVLPTKKKMNLYVKVKDGNSLSLVIPTAIILAVIVFAVYKIGVVERYQKLNELRSEVRTMSAQAESLKEQTANYNDVYLDYVHYTRHYETPEEAQLVLRVKILDLVTKTMEPIGEFNSVSITDNMVSVTITVSELEDFASIRRELEKTDWVDTVYVNNASLKQDGDTVTASISFSEFLEEEEQ